MEQINNEKYVKDKKLAPYLLAASYVNLINFTGIYINNGELFLKFHSKEQAETLINMFEMHTGPNIPANDIFDAIEFFWKKVYEIRNLEMNKYDRHSKNSII